ncbi:TIGR03936 family radical SAM-associated protein [Levilinea saccharolytica]|jgi:radical SAM-linked protein|uniref:DUF2344 domain-containing protein n=1 Tax=Levilinea saccharolytica TaxID=229921 RepID=A0A0P6XEY3_9CHLR|nr:TIGR03936 family radical SAM-associated protein [Levilinea saccharolytica]KPL81779.1 hypothetical protein ADN01_09295 [Levilinea saccharolytica]GAP17931.1 radical SAM-linked protein [Levilinea saccharolytica]
MTIRCRILYTKGPDLRYTANLDVHRIWERTFRRAQLPLAYSQGFHPQPRLNQACPLPLGMTSQAEVLDAWLEEDLPPAQVQSALQKAAPPGLLIQQVEIVDLSLPSLQTQVRSAEYTLWLLDPPSLEALRAAVDDLLAASELMRVRREKQYNLRPLVESLTVASSQPPTLHMQLSAREGATGRPEEVLDALGIPANAARVERTALHFQSS